MSTVEAALYAYAVAVPADGAFILQRLIVAPNEAGLLYVRHPGARKGALVAMTLRHGPRVIGDGQRSIAALVSADPRCRAHASTYGASIGKAGFHARSGQGRAGVPDHYRLPPP